jgi:hypothetical protein
VPKNLPRVEPFSFLDKTQLLKLKLKAMRAGVWYRALPRIDRVLIDLAMKVTCTIRSISLAESILSITRKLEEVLESKLARATREIGAALAYKLSTFAQKWGNKAAYKWAGDSAFARYLAAMKINGHATTG